MKSIQPLPKHELKELQFLFNIVDKKMGFVPTSIKTMARIPALVTSYSSFFANVFGQHGEISPFIGLKLAFKNLVFTLRNFKRKDRLSIQLKHLVAYISSNTAGCRYCQAHTISQAAETGVEIDKLKDAWNFENSPHFNNSERSALRFAVAASSIPNATTSAHFDDLRKYYNENQIVELGATVSLFGFLNRWNDTFATQLEDTPTAFAEEVLKESGWNKGKH